MRTSWQATAIGSTIAPSRSAERIGQTVQRVRGHGPHALQRARRIDADELQVVADVAVARRAGGTLPAGIERTHGHAVARAPARRPRCPALRWCPTFRAP